MEASLRCWSLEGNRQSLDGGAMFGNVPRALWQRWIAPDGDHRIPLACRCLLVEGLGGRLVLFETGIGAFFAPDLKDRYGVAEDEHRLLESLAAAGFRHEDVDVVVLSHLHFDHAGGLLTRFRAGRDPELLFPHATYVVGARAWERAKNPHPRDRASFIPRLTGLLEASGRLELITGTQTPILGPDVSFRPSDGHTPGMLLSQIGGRGGLVFCADLIPGRPWVHVPVTMGYDRFPELLIDEKRALLEDALDEGIALFFTHDPGCALARVIRDDRGRFAPGESRERLDATPLPLPV